MQISMTFIILSRATLVKDEKYYDKFDKAFEIYFKGIEKHGRCFSSTHTRRLVKKSI